MKMHKLVEVNGTTLCDQWLRGWNGFYASRWWKYVTCRNCLKRKGKKS